MSEERKLDFTGERFTPECVREIWYEHYHRYAFTKNLVSGKYVLDAACGEGYGSNILAGYALQVDGIDIDSESVTHAKNKYKKDNLRFKEASCIDLPYPDNGFDVIVSFETLEHLAEQEEMLSEFKRVLKPNGFIIISTPDKKYYSDEAGFTNEFHIKELYQNEFKSLLDKHWHAQEWYSQALSFQSILENQSATNREFDYDVLNDSKLDNKNGLNLPKYHVVIAAKNKEDLPQMCDLHLFSDSQQSVYEHYNEMVRGYIDVAEKYMAVNKRYEKLLSIPILGKVLKYFERKNHGV